MCILSQLDYLSTKIVVLEQENQIFIENLKQLNVEKAQHGELLKHIFEIETTLLYHVFPKPLQVAKD